MTKPNYWVLYGTEEYIYDEREDELDIRKDEKVVALFTSREKAYAYVEAAKAPTYRDSITWRNQNKGGQFKKDSVLAGSTGYEIRPLEVPELEVDPKI